jgi:hypothetical protein
MILKFPDLTTLQLALTSSVIPPAVSRAPAVAVFDGDAVWVQTAGTLSRGAHNPLKRMGVQAYRSLCDGLETQVCCWLQLLPLRPEPDALAGLEQATVLFDMPDGAQMTRLAGEMLRLGNDRQGFRWLEDTAGGKGRALLRVVGPPYYSLLRALDRQGRPGAPVAYVERATGVWVEAGFNHPLAERIKPPAGKLLLLRPLRRWTALPDEPFRDVYEALQFQVPDGPSPWQEGRLQEKVQVRLRLRPGGSPDNPELWVLAGDGVEELDRFVQNSDDQLLGRLAFAVGEQDGRKTVVVRVRPSRQPPPQLVLGAVGYRHHLKLPNLFLPVGMGLHPPLRRDKARELLAGDVDQVTWLAPGPDGTFTPQSLPEDAFRPLTDWVDYVLDHDRDALDAWVAAARFDFEDFVCNEDGTPKPRKAEPPERSRTPKRLRAPEPPEKDDGNGTRDESTADGNPVAAAELDPFAEVPAAPPSELEQQLRGLEQQFLELEGALDLPQRRALWPRMARCNAGLGKHDDAGLCWLHAIWDEKAVPAGAAAQWFAAEAAAAQRGGEGEGKRPRSWLARLTGPKPPRPELSGEDLDRLLGKKDPSMADVRALAAYLVWAGSQPHPPAALLQRLQPVHPFLQAHERLLPVRAMWLAWFHLAHLSGGDALALARARDRLLERLFQNGLRPEQDLPSFLRFGGQPTAQRFRAVREWLGELAEEARRWTHENVNSLPDSVVLLPRPKMDPYVNLVFAFGLARLGEADAARQRLAQSRQLLAGADEAHAFLVEAFAYRITQALEGRPHTGPLPTALLETLGAMERRAAEDAQERRLRGAEGRGPHDAPSPRDFCYVVNKLREHSRILEPDQKVLTYNLYLVQDHASKQLADIANLNDRREIVARLKKALAGVPRGAEGPLARFHVLKSALQAAPRVGQDFACEVLEQAVAAYDALPQPDALHPHDLSEYLERALFLAGHFDVAESIRALVGRFEGLLQRLRGSNSAQGMDALAGECFRTLRKLGMRDEIDRLLAQMAELVLDGRPLSAVPPEVLPALVLVAGEWYFFGRDSEAEPILEAARAVLLRGNLPPLQQTTLTCRYARAIGQAPVAVAQKRLREIFTSVRGVYDQWLSRTHFYTTQIRVMEAVVLAVASDDFTQGTQARRWLDEDEFLVRRRVHADVRAHKAEA